VWLDHTPLIHSRASLVKLLDKEGGLDMSVVVDEVQNTASYYVVGGEVRVER